MATILIVDDRPSNRQFLVTLLGYGGHRLLEAANGAEALDLVHSERPELVITDILMPVMDGFEFVQRMRAQPVVADTRVIFYTASYSAPQAEALAKSCGVQKVMPKPSEPQVILTAVQEALGKPATAALVAPAGAEDATGGRSIDDSMSLYLKDLGEVRARFEGLVADSGKVGARRDAVKELSRKFAANVESMQRVTTRLSALLEVGMEMMGERDPHRVIELFFAAVGDLVESQYSAVGVLDESEQALKHVFAKGVDPALLRGEEGRGGVFASLLSGRRVLRMRSADGKASAEGLPRGHPPVHSLMGVPVESAGRVYGWMYFAGARTAEGFSEEDVRVATVMTRKLALLYENAVLYDEIQRHAARLQIEMSERKRAEAALQRFRLAMDNSGDMILISDRATLRHVDVNQTACKLLGYSREELLRMGPPDILPVSREELGKAYDELIADPSRASGMRSYYRCKDGSQLPFESTRRLLRSGDTWLIVAISRDIRPRLAAEQALRESEAGLRRAQTMAKLAHVVTGPEGEFETWSESLPLLAGVQPEQLPRTTREWLGILHPDDREVFRATAIAAGAARERRKVKYRLRRADGVLIHVRQTMDPLHVDGDGELRWFNTIQDVSEQKEAEEKIERLNRVYAVLSGINTLIARAHGRDELFREACRVAVKDGGFRMAWIGVVDPASERVTPVASDGDVRGFFDTAPLVDKGSTRPKGMAWRAVSEKRPMVSNDVKSDAQTSMKEECRERGINSLAILPLIVGGEGIGVLALYAAEPGFFDEEELKLLVELAGDVSFALDHLQKAEKLDYLAYYDALTGLANRTHFHERLTQFIDTAARDGGKLAVLILDIDRFRTVNDSLGREAGDELLKQIAQRMKQTATDPDSIARISADRFAIVRPKLTSESDVARHNERKLEECFGAPFQVGETELRIAAKVGIAIYPADGADAETLYRNAEAALRKAKATGERTLFYAQEMTERVAEKLSLETKLRRALDNEEFVLHYQPKVELENRRIVGVEALIRWHSPERGLVPPGHFIPLLEETGLILQVGAWAIRRAILDHRHWLRQGIKAPRVAVNVSQIQMRQQDFVEVVSEAVAQGANPTGLDLEITESLLMEDVQGNIRKLAAIRAQGVSIAIDDFGTGYSSLAYLAKLPVQALKIDRSFVVAMLEDPAAMALVQTIISLAHALRLKVIAEGVETEDQAKMLRLLRCDEIQGYLVSKPKPIEEITPLLRERS